MENLDSIKLSNPILAFGMQSMLDSMRNSINIETNMTGSTIINNNPKVFGSSFMLKIEEEKRECESGKESLLNDVNNKNRCIKY